MGLPRRRKRPQRLNSLQGKWLALALGVACYTPNAFEKSLTAETNLKLFL